MSTFSGLLVSMTGALAHDVYGRMLRPKSTPDQRMRMFKVFAVVVGGVAVLLGSFVEPLEINFMVGQAFAIAAASYFPLLFMAVWWRQLTMKGAGHRHVGRRPERRRGDFADKLQHTGAGAGPERRTVRHVQAVEYILGRASVAAHSLRATRALGRARWPSD